MVVFYLFLLLVALVQQLCGMSSIYSQTELEPVVYEVLEAYDALTNLTIISPRKIPSIVFPDNYSIYTIRGGSFIYNFFNRAFFDADKQLVPLISGHIHRAYPDSISRAYADMTLLSSDCISNAKKRVTFYKNVFVVPFTICHYWHFQVEIISQVYLMHKFLKQANGEFNASNTIILITTPSEPKNCMPYFLEYHKQLHLLDAIVPNENTGKKFPIHYVPPDTAVSVASNFSFISSSRTSVRGSVPAAFALDVMYKLARSYDKKVYPHHQYLFIGREEEFKRKLTNMEALQDIFNQYGISVFYPTKAQISFGDTVQMLHGARLLIAPSGTGFSGNVPFLNPNHSVIMELFPSPIHTSTGAVVAKYRKFKYYIPLACLYKDPDVADGIVVNTTHLRLGMNIATRYLKEIEWQLR